MSALERSPEVPASTPDEDLGHGTEWTGSQETPGNSHGDLTFLRQHEWVLEVSIVTLGEL